MFDVKNILAKVMLITMSVIAWVLMTIFFGGIGMMTAGMASSLEMGFVAGALVAQLLIAFAILYTFGEALAKKTAPHLSLLHQRFIAPYKDQIRLVWDVLKPCLALGTIGAFSSLAYPDTPWWEGFLYGFIALPLIIAGLQVCFLMEDKERRRALLGGLKARIRGWFTRS